MEPYRRCRNEFRREELGNGDSRVTATIYLDGIVVGSLVVAAGPARDIDDLWAGTATVEDLAARWATKVRR